MGPLHGLFYDKGSFEYVVYWRGERIAGLTLDWAKHDEARAAFIRNVMDEVIDKGNPSDFIEFVSSFDCLR